MKRVIMTAAVLVLCLATPLSAADKRYPDWPCMQLKVPELSLAAVWSGPSIEEFERTWMNDPEAGDLVQRLAARRTSMEEAQKLIVDFVTGSSVVKQRKAIVLFAGLFDTLNRQRAEVMNGLERFSRSQKQLAESIRSNTIKLRELQDSAGHDEMALQELSRQIEWDTRIFEDRRRSTAFACEVPVEIERRLFALGRAIQSTIE
jgi:hypothetical protein